MVKTQRDNFSIKIVEAAAKRVGYVCSFPDCNVHLVGPSSESNESVNSIREAAHIFAASPGGPRFDPNMTPQERKSIDNCLILCRNCAALIDRDVSKYTSEILRAYKKNAEINALNKIGKQMSQVVPDIDFFAFVKNKNAELENSGTYFSRNMKTKNLLESDFYIKPFLKTSLANIEASEYFENNHDNTVIKGKAGAGKSLLLYHRYFLAVNRYLSKKTKSIPVFLRAKELQKKKLTISEYLELPNINLSKLSFIFFVDGLDEIRFSAKLFFESEIFKHSTLITCRDDFYNSNEEYLKNWTNVGICNWSKENLGNFFDRYCDLKNDLNLSDKREFFLNLVSQSDSVVSSPLLITLLMFTLDDPEIIQKFKNFPSIFIEVLILEASVQKYVAREIYEKNLLPNIIDDKKKREICNKILSLCSYTYYKAAYSTTICNNDLILVAVENEKKSLESSFDEKVVGTIASIVLSEKNEMMRLITHEKIFEFLVAKYILLVYEGVFHDADFLKMTNKPEVFRYLILLIKQSPKRGQVALDWLIEQYTNHIGEFKTSKHDLESEHAALYCTNLIMPLARLGFDNSEKFLIEEYHKNYNPTLNLIFLDCLVQHASIETRLKYEDIYYREIQSDRHFAAINIGCRLDYAQCTEHSEKLLVIGDDGVCEWQKLFHAMQGRFAVKSIGQSHYTLRRIELLTIKQLLISRKNKENTPEFFNEVKDFLLGLQEEIFTKADKNESPNNFDEKVKVVYEELLLVL